MKRYVVCLGAVNLDLRYEVSDPEGFLAAWGTNLSRGGEEVLTPQSAVNSWANGEIKSQMGIGEKEDLDYFLHHFVAW